MNRQRHRVVYNAARGLRMAVAECARSVGPSTASSLGVASALLALSLVFPGATSAQAQAQIHAHPNAPATQQPTVLGAGNGVPVVNIQTPSAAGVSRNTYRQFDVGPAGVVLNNSRSGAGSALAGAVPANPWLAGGSARVILNEVQSATPSQLRGFIEVAGPRADVVVANPAGIVAHGTGFINAARATLTTGTPQLDASGGLSGFAVRSGQVRIEGGGLDARQADHAAILARAIELNAAFWAQQASAVTGSNHVSADASQVTPAAPDPSAPKPRFALDVAAIGGMYAGKIHLIGTEAGLGVNTAGLIDARGTLTLDVNGWLSGSGTARTYGDRIDIRAEGVRNEHGAVIAAREHLAIDAQGAIVNREDALLLSLGDMRLQAGERIENRSAAIEALGSLDVATPRLLNANEHLQTELVASPAQRVLRLRHEGVDHRPETLGLNFEALDDLANDAARRVLLPSADYPFDRYPALAASWAVPRYTWARGFEVELSRHSVLDCAECEPRSVDTYAPDHGIWQRLGVASPGPAPTYDGPPCDETLCSLPQQQVHQAWRVQAERYASAKSTQQALLDERINAYNASVAARTLSAWTVIDVSETTHEPRVRRSEPARLAAGGDLRIGAGEVINAHSHLLAGGALQVVGAQIQNPDSEAIARTEQQGTSVYSYVQGGGTFTSDDRKYLSEPYSARTERAVPLNIARQSGQSADATPALSGPLANALFAPASQPGAGYLIETDPRLLDGRAWLSSAQVFGEADALHKRLGDGFVEQALVREQIAALTGQRRLAGFADDEAQYLALLQAGGTFAHAQGLRPGIRLSPRELAALTSDLVWLEAEPITLPDGRTHSALVPRVYLMPRPGELGPTGSIMGGQQVQLSLSGGLVNGGSIAGRELVRIDAQGIHSSGLIASQGSVGLQARDDLRIAGGEVRAGEAIALIAGRDLSVASTLRDSEVQAGNSRYQRSGIDRVARLHVSDEAGVLLAQAGRDLAVQGAQIELGAGATGVLSAGRDLVIGTVTTRQNDDIRYSADHRQRTERTQEHASRLSGGELQLSAGRDLTVRGGEIEAQGDLSLQARSVLRLEAARETLTVDEHHRVRHGDRFSRKNVSEDLRLSESTAQVARLQGRDLSLQGGAVLSEGARLGAQRDLSIHSASVTLLLDALDLRVLEREVYVNRRSGALGGDAHESKTDIDTTLAQTRAQVSTLSAGREIRVGVAERTELRGARLSAPDIRFERSPLAQEGTAGQLLLGASVEQDAASVQRRNESDRVWQKMQARGHETEVAKLSELHGQVDIDPRLSVAVEVPHGPQAPNTAALQAAAGGSSGIASRLVPLAQLAGQPGRPTRDQLREQARVLGEQPGLQYLKALSERPDIDWQPVELARREWDHKQQGLTETGAAVLTIVVAYFTAGAASGAASTTTATAASTTAAGTTAAAGTAAAATAAASTAATIATAAAKAALVSLTSTAAVSFVNNGGDLSDVFKDLGSSANVKKLLVTMVTAGVVQGLAENISFSGKALDQITVQDGTGAFLARQLIEHSARASTQALLLGTPLDEALEGALVSGLLSTASAMGANAIGDMAVAGQLNAAGKRLLHALVGCASGAVQAGSQGCKAGGTGALVGELSAEWFNASGTRSPGEVLAFAQLMAGLSGALVAKDGNDARSVTIASTTGGNAAEHNYLAHAERMALNKAQRSCLSTGNAQDCQTASELRLKDTLSDRLLSNAAATCEADGCVEVANFIQTELTRVGCTAPSACPDQQTLNGYWRVAQEKAQGLTPVYPEDWVLAAKGVADLAKFGIATFRSSTESLRALQQLRKTSFDGKSDATPPLSNGPKRPPAQSESKPPAQENYSAPPPSGERPPLIVRVDELVPTHGKTMSNKQMDGLIKSIRAEGFKEPIVVTEFEGKLYILDGHHRALAAPRAGVYEVPIIKVPLPYSGYKSPADLEFTPGGY